MSLPAEYSAIILIGPEVVELRRTPLLAPGPGEVLLRVDAATTCGTDLKVFRRGAHPRMLTPPCAFGHEVSGTVAAIGSGVDSEADGVSEGSAVVVSNSASCGRCGACRNGRENLCEDLHYLNGAFAEYLSIPSRFTQRSLHRRPADLKPEVAALAEPLACVLHGVERMRLEAELEVLVLGAGPIGLMFVHELAQLGHRVTVLDPHLERLEIATVFGARATHQVTDRDRLALEVRAADELEQSFDAAIETTGTPSGWQAAAALTRAGGTVNFFGGCAAGSEVQLDATQVHYGELTLLGTYHHRPATFSRALERLSAHPHTLSRLITDRRPLAAVEAALRDMAARREIKVALLPGSDQLSVEGGSNSGSGSIPSPSARRS